MYPFLPDYSPWKCKKNGKRMIKFCRENELLIDNNFWEKNMKDRYIFIATERNAKSVIDFITYTKDIQHDIKGIRNIPEAEIGSNHRPVITNIGTTEIEFEEEKKYNTCGIKP